jgi:hypothetical protein
MRLEDPKCGSSSSSLAQRLSKDDVLYQLCVSQQINLGSAGSITYPDPGLTALADPGQDLSACGPLGPCKSSGSALCISCGSIEATVTSSALAQGNSLTTADASVVDAAKQTCRATYPDAHENPPSSTTGGGGDPYDSGACYRGSLGESAMTVRATALDVSVARADYSSHVDAYDIAMESCLIRKEGNDKIAELNEKHEDTMTKLRDGKLAADIVGEAAEALKDCLYTVADADVLVEFAGGACAAGAVEAAANSTADALESLMQQAEAANQLEVAALQNDTDWKTCTNDATMELVSARGDELRLQRAIADQQLASYRLNQGVINAQTAFDDGNQTLAKPKTARCVRPISIPGSIKRSPPIKRRCIARAASRISPSARSSTNTRPAWARARLCSRPRRRPISRT